MMVKAGDAGRRGDRRARPAPRGGRHHHRRRQLALHRHQRAAPRSCAANRHPVRRHGRLRRRGGRAARAEHHARRRRRRPTPRSSRSSPRSPRSVDGTPCVAYIGPDGRRALREDGAQRHRVRRHAAHRRGLRPAARTSPASTRRRSATIFEEWNTGELDSFLIEITAEGASPRPTPETGKPLVDVILDKAEQKGTGTWTVQVALDLGVPLTAITEAVFARGAVGAADERKKASTTLSGPAPGQGSSGSATSSARTPTSGPTPRATGTRGGVRTTLRWRRAGSRAARRAARRRCPQAAMCLGVSPTPGRSRRSGPPRREDLRRAKRRLRRAERTAQKVTNRALHHTPHRLVDADEERTTAMTVGRPP